MKIERQFESKNYVVRMSIMSLNAEAHSTLSDHAATTNEELGTACIAYNRTYEELFETQWRLGSERQRSRHAAV
jgi:hypothetical protein